MGKVLIIGSGAREHALGWQLAQCSHVSRVVYAPGNAGTAHEIKGRNVSVDVNSIDALVNLVQQENPDMTVVGPEAPLAAGLVNRLHEKGYDRVIGPTQEAARLEASKIFSYNLMKKVGVPQARSKACYTLVDTLRAIIDITTEKGVVLKADGLAGGKGVLVFDNREEAFTSVDVHMQKYGNRILVSERLSGEEFSVFALSDGEHVVPFSVSFQDHKRRDNGDKGPNTGGMGAYGPAPVADESVVNTVCDTVLKPVVREMNERGTPYKGILYAGMMMTEQGPKVLEYNVRFGDPECRLAMMLIQSDLYETFTHLIEGTLDKTQVSFFPNTACTVVMAAKGYPENPQIGFRIYGIDEAEKINGVKVFHSGTRDENHQLMASGGRVLSVTASSSFLEPAVQNTYEAVRRIENSTGTGRFHYRTDIAQRALGK